MWTGVGAGAVACDLDADGTPELVVSSDALPDAPDLLRILGPPDGPDRWRSPTLAGPVWTIACGDVDGDDLPEAVALPYGPSPDAWLVEAR